MCGLFKCYIHDFETDSMEEMDKHCYKTKHKLEVWKNGKKTIKPHPKPKPHKYYENQMMFGPFSKENPPSDELLKALETNNSGKLLNCWLDQFLDNIRKK